MKIKNIKIEIDENNQGILIEENEKEKEEKEKNSSIVKNLYYKLLSFKYHSLIIGSLFCFAGISYNYLKRKHKNK